MTTSKFQLGFMVMFHPHIHGITLDSDPAVLKHFLTHSVVSTNWFLESSSQDIREAENMMSEDIEFYKNILQNAPRRHAKHPYIRHYTHILRNSLEIIQTETLTGREYIGYIKTFWLKIIQRKWKKIYKIRKEIETKRKALVSLKTREIRGQWPKECRVWS